MKAFILKLITNALSDKTSSLFGLIRASGILVLNAYLSGGWIGAAFAAVEAVKGFLSTEFIKPKN